MWWNAGGWRSSAPRSPARGPALKSASPGRQPAERSRDAGRIARRPAAPSIPAASRQSTRPPRSRTRGTAARSTAGAGRCPAIARSLGDGGRPDERDGRTAVAMFSQAARKIPTARSGSPEQRSRQTSAVAAGTIRLRQKANSAASRMAAILSPGRGDGGCGMMTSARHPAARNGGGKVGENPR